MREILVQEGEIAKVGQQLCIIEVEDSPELDASPDVGPPLDSTPAPTESIQPSTASSQDEPAPQEVSVTPPSEPTRPRKHHPLDPSRPPVQAENTPSPKSTSSDKPQFAPSPASLAAPSVRNFARKNSIEDLSVLHPGSGKNGRIELQDVQAYLSRAVSGETQASSSSPPSTTEPVDEPQELPLGRTRLAMFRAMTKVRRLI